MCAGVELLLSSLQHRPENLSEWCGGTCPNNFPHSALVHTHSQVQRNGSRVVPQRNIHGKHASKPADNE